jgi:hypothetical protein
MKIVTIDGGRVLDLVPLEELRPEGGVHLPDYLSAIAARYSFASVPTDLADAIKSGAKFAIGKFKLDGEPISIKEMGLYSDGIICEAYGTTFADIILDDLFQWTRDEFKLKERTTPIHRTYTSGIVCTFDKSVESGLGKLAAISELLSKAYFDSYGWKYRFDLQRLAFNVDPKDIPHLRSTNFILERRVGTPYSENRYFSIAPLRTEDHIALLETIERELLA